ncbi:MAG: endonuclease [Actinomycetales bacterium]|nr:MAG: endonuclease [Actinomycetales bacterium]
MQSVQATFDDLGTPLHDVTFVVVDLETTGGSARESAITEVGAVKVRGGEVLGEFQTLVNPGLPIPPFIQLLTGISDTMVAQSPRIEVVLPAFFDFSRGAVLVAHNAGFDISFLKAAAASLDIPWPGFPVVDTVTLARHVVPRGETRNHKLATLAAFFGAEVTPDHRALHDARATVDVLHGLLARVGNIGVNSLEELQSYTSRVSTAQRRKRFLADDLPAEPGVYIFRDAQQRPLYVGTSTNIRARARSYFTASEQRTRMSEMVALAESIHPVVCQTTLEAQVRELRLIATHKPPYNRRSTRPERAVWVKLTAEHFPRLSIVREVRDDSAAGARYAGPFSSRQAAEAAVAAVHEIVPLRQCTTRLSASPHDSACVLAELGRCDAPCEGGQDPSDYARHTRAADDLFTGDSRAFVAATHARMRLLADQERFEDAAAVRDRLAHLLRGTARAQRLAPLATNSEIVAARRVQEGGWELICVRHGRFAGTSLVPRGADPTVYVEALQATAEVVTPPNAPAPAASAEEAELVLRWLESPGVRIVVLDGEWSCPVGGAQAARSALADTSRAGSIPRSSPESTSPTGGLARLGA